MSGLFIRSRTWVYKDGYGAYRVQAMDCKYINILSSYFARASVASVLVDANDFSFVSSYRATLSNNIDLIPLFQAVQGNYIKRALAQFRNMLRIALAMQTSSHVVVFMASISAVWTVIVAFILRKPILLYSGNDWAADTSIKLRHTTKMLRWIGAWLTDRLETLALRLADVRLVNSPKLFDKCRAMRGVCERVRPVSNFAISDAYLRADSCLGPVIRIVYPAAIIPRKNHETVLRAFALLQKRGLNAELRLPGASDTDLLMNLRALAEELGISSQVHFLGYFPDKSHMIELLRDSDIFVLPSLNEGFPRVVWEAMLQSLPCAVSRIPNIEADLGARDVAILFDPLNAVDMADALYRIAADGELRRRLIHNAHAYALEIFAEGWEQQLGRVLKAWQ